MSFLLFALFLGQVQAPSTAAKAADKFALDLPAEEGAPAPAPREQPAAPVQPTVVPGYSLDTPIAELIADSRTKAILDRDVPGLSDDENLPKFKALSLRKLAPLTGGQMTAELLDRVERDLAGIEGVVPAAKTTESRRALPMGR